MNRWLPLMAIVVMLGAVASSQSKSSDVTVTIQQGVGGYDGNATIDPYKTPMKTHSGSLDINKVSLEAQRHPIHKEITKSSFGNKIALLYYPH